MMLEKSINPAASAAAGAAGGSKKITDFLIFGLKNQPTSPPDDYMLFNLKKDGTTQPFSTSEVFQGTTVFANNTDDGYKYFVTKNLYDQNNPMLFGKMDKLGNVTYINNNILSSVGGSVNTIGFTAVPGVPGSYNGLTGPSTGMGYGAQFDIIVDNGATGPGPAGTVSNVSVTNISGDLYKQGDVITIHGTAFGGSQSLLINVNSVSGYSSPSSMYYEGNGNFIYLDRIAFMDTAFDEGFPKVVRINTNGTASFVSKHDYNLDGFYPTSLFEYDGDTWGTAITGYNTIALVGKYDINTSSFDQNLATVVINNIPGVSISKVWFIVSAINVSGKIYCNMLVVDKETSNFIQCIAELNMQTLEAEYLYHVNSSDYILLNIINP